MQTLSNVPSKSFVGYGVLLLVFIFSFFGVDIKDDAPAIVAAIGNFIGATSSLIQAISTLVGLGLALWGHLELARKHGALRQIAFQNGVPAPVIDAPVAALAATPAAVAAKVAAFFFICACALSATGCAGQAPIPPQFNSPPAATPLSANDTKVVQTLANLDTATSLATVETSSATATSLGMYIGIKQTSTMETDGELLYGSGIALEDFTGGTSVPITSPVSDIVGGLKLSVADQQSANNIASLANGLSSLIAIPYNWISSEAANSTTPSVTAYAAKVFADNVHAVGKGVCDVTSQYASITPVALNFELKPVARDGSNQVVYSF